MSKSFPLSRKAVRGTDGEPDPVFVDKCQKYLGQERASLESLLADPFVQQLIMLLSQAQEALAKRPPIYMNDDNYIVLARWLTKVDRSVGNVDQILLLLKMVSQEDN